MVSIGRAERIPHDEPIRVVIGEDQFLVREGIRQALTSDRSIKVVGLAESRDSLQALIEQEHPDVVVTDIRMPPTGEDEGIEIAAWLRQGQPNTGVVLLSQYAEPQYALRLLEPGSRGRAYLLKDRISSRTDLVAAVREVAAGGSMVDAKVVEGIVAAHQASEASPLASLSPRERDVLAAMAQGKSNAAIAGSLHLSKGAVEKHINSIFQKLDLPDEHEVSRRVLATLLFLASA